LGQLQSSLKEYLLTAFEIERMVSWNQYDMVNYSNKTLT
jgi:hypothetical protein